jgi:glucosamine 6-phosphate synthetase-like amidotransferase/phosphosugar isomerase protein
LFKQLGVPRVAQVDSEAVAALIAFSKDKPWQALTEVYGTAALAWITANDPRNLHLARLNSSPLWLVQSNTGSLFYGSTKETVENACIMTDCDMDWIHEAKEGEYFQVRDGRIINYETFKPAKYEPLLTYPLYAGSDLDWYGRYDQYKADKYSKWWDKHDEFLNF